MDRMDRLDGIEVVSCSMCSGRGAVFRLAKDREKMGTPIISISPKGPVIVPMLCGDCRGRRYRLISRSVH